MKTPRHCRHFAQNLFSALAGFALVVGASGAFAQNVANYPNRPIRLVVPYPPGGSIDAMGRMVGNRLTEALKQPVVVENRPGASGTIGASMVSKAAPDGYTLCLCAGTSLTIGNLLYDTAPQNPTEDFVPVMAVGAAAFIAAVNASSPANTIQDLARAARERGDHFSIGGISEGTPSRLAGEAFRKATGSKAIMVPYNGSAPMLTALLSGDIDMIYDTPDVIMPHVKSGKLKALGVAQPERLSEYPDIPTLQESGFPDFSFQLWAAVVAPRGTPDAIVHKLESVMGKVWNTEAVKSELKARGMISLGEGTTQTQQRMKSEAKNNAALMGKKG